MSQETYPDPSSEQVSSNGGPFYTPNDSNVFSQLSQQLDTSARARQNAQAEQAGAYGNQDAHQHPDAHASHYAADSSSHMQGGSTIAEDALRAAAQVQHEDQSMHLAQHMMHMESQDGHIPDQEHEDRPPRARRPKVSRACDECRRKKIRCDALETDPAPACSNCKRTGAGCRFSRMQMKRGPSKGYIKELSDKINSLESRMPGYGGQYRQSFDHEVQDGEEHVQAGFAVPSAPMSRKRTHSMYEREFQGGMWENGVYNMGQRDSNTWMSADQKQSYGQRRESELGPHELDDSVGDTNLQGWDETVVDEYYRTIHPSLPLLAQNKTRLRERLRHCTQKLCEAFLATLHCCVRYSPYSNLEKGPDQAQITRTAANLISDYQYEPPTTRSRSSNLVYLQTLVLMTLACDNYGPEGAPGPPRAEWLGRAIGTATHLKLNGMDDALMPHAEHADEDHDLGRRAWWVLFILDKFHSCASGTIAQIPNDSRPLGAEDRVILGDLTYHLARLCHILGHTNTILHTSNDLLSLANIASPIVSQLIHGELDRFRESVESALAGDPNPLQICYLYVSLLLQRLTAPLQLRDLQQILTPALRIATLLSSQATGPVLPLMHHFAALSVLTLTELAHFPQCADAVRQGLGEAEKSLLTRQDSQGWNIAIKAAVAKGLRKTAELALQRPSQPNGESQTAVDLRNFADAAKGDDIGGKEVPVIANYDPTALLRHGYLTALVEGQSET